MDKRIVITALVSSIGGGVVGGAITYLTLKKTFAERAQRDIEDVKQAYKDKFEGKRVVNDFSVDADPEIINPITPKTMTQAEREQAEKFVRDLGYKVPTDMGADPNEEQIQIDQAQSIYDRTETPPEGVVEVTDIRMRDYDIDSLIANKKPHIISEDDFHNTRNEWDKISIMYYEDDDILADENDKPIDDIDYFVGEIHLNLFGVMAKDRNQVYVRNGQISADIEITRNIGSYSESVFGVPSGSEQVGSRRMRDDD